MDLQHDNYNSELRQGKAKPPERWQIGEKELNGDTGRSPQQPCNDSRPPLVQSRVQDYYVIRAPEDLHVHAALRELDYIGVAEELNEAERIRHHAPTPILITSEGTILSGFGRWRSALLHGEREIQCIEYVLREEDSLQFILVYHKPQRGWNRFVRTRVALTLEPHFQSRALQHMRDGGRYKGSANLPNPQRIDVRREIAEIAGVGARSVGNVKIILKGAHPRLLAALRDGTLTINKALGLCKFPVADQLEAFTLCIEERAVDKVIRRTLTRNRQQKPCLDASSVLATLQLCESRHPGSVVVMRSRSGRTTISVENDLLERINSEGVAKT